MPVYEYFCKQCGERVSEERSMTDDSPNPSHCGTAMNKAFNFAPSFKGDGFYVNDKRKRSGE